MIQQNCRKAKFCDFIVQKDTIRVLYEVCKLCGRKQIYNKTPTGRIASRRFLKEHIRDFCQPLGYTRKIYEQVYGLKQLKERQKMMKANKQTFSMEDALERGSNEAKQTLKFWHQLKSKGYTEREIEKLIL